VSENDNKWEQPEAPPPPLFTGKKERDLVKQVTDEVMERVIGTSILYYPISVKHSDFHPLYGEAINKTYLPPVHVEVLAEWQGEETTTTGFGIDKKSAVTIHFHKRRLTEDQNLFVREGDFIQYGEQKYEIVSLGQPRQLFGQPDAKIEITAQCVRARDGTFPSEAYPDPEEDDPRFTAAPACDPINEIRVLTGDTTSTGGSGEQPCGEVYERPGTPPPPLFTGKKETDLVKQVGDELLERVVGQQVVYFPISVPYSDFHDLYGEAINKTFLPPIRVFAAVEWKGSDTTTTSFGIDKMSAIDVKFHKRRLTEDQNLFVREGDFVLYGSILYEITKIGQPRLLFGKIDEKYEVVASCVRAREGTFRLSEVEGTVSEFDLDSVTACENANIVVPEGVDNTMSNVGSGEGIFKNKTGINFNMKTLVEGDNVTITSTSNEITISAVSGSGGTWDGHLDGNATISGTMDVSGSTRFGNELTDTHVFTGSFLQTGSGATSIFKDDIEVHGNLSSSLAMSASTFYGDGSNLSGIITDAWNGQHEGDAAITGALDVSRSTAFGSTPFDSHDFAGTVTMSGNVLPYSRFSHDLGSRMAPWNSIYVRNSSLHFVSGTTDVGVLGVSEDSVLTYTGSMSASSFIGSDMTVSTLTASGIEVHGHIAPASGNLYDIGTIDKQVRDIYVSTGSIIFGGTHKITIDPVHDTFNFDSPTSTGLSIPRLDEQALDTSSPQDGTIVYNTTKGVFNFRQEGEWREIDSSGSNSTTASYIDASNVVGLADYVAASQTGIQAQLDALVAQVANIEYGGGGGTNTGSGSISVAVADGGAGILTMIDDGDGPNRAILQEYAANPVAHAGKTLYITDILGAAPMQPFNMANKFYFNEGGVWHKSPFYTDQPLQSPYSSMPTDMHDILNLDATRNEDRAILQGLHENAASYGGRAIYLRETGSIPVGDFLEEGKYYFNEGGIWHASSFYAKEEDEE
jgi:hypothetical protein